MKEKPTGLVTFLFTDIEGSTRLAQEFPESLPAALEKHHAIMRKATESNNGFVYEIVGDAFCCAFHDAKDAVNAAVDAQINLSNEKWNDAVIKIRIGIHSGKAEWNNKRYMGYITLARAARVMSATFGEQIIISNDTYELMKEKFFGQTRRSISFRDLGERRLKDVIKPIRLFQIVSPGLREDFPPLKTLDARPNNLPVHLTHFIGREGETRLVKDLLKQTHLLTITGSGGSGKTRFALQVGADVIDDFANGVWFVELASLFEPALLPHEIMKVFEIKEEPKRNLVDTLCNYFRDKEMLIILDNCEHLIEPCAKLAEKLLSNSPKLKIIATSREALRCEGEQTHRILSLEFPNPKDKDSPEALSHFEAVRLFIERALSVDSTFRVNNNNAPALAEICYHLDGIPLAIELAAVRTNVLSVEQIYARLNDRFVLLTGGKRTALPRQQTLRALIDWSYDLLSEQEKILWRRLSVFVGGWTIEAAENICSDEMIKKEEVLVLLNQLSEKSIIIFEKEKERYGMLESLKQYGKEKLKVTNEESGFLSKHLNYFTQFSITVEPKLEGFEAMAWLEKLEAEHSNLQSAIAWSLTEENIEKGAELAVALDNFWDIRGYYLTAKELLGKFLINTPVISKFSIGKLLLISGKYSIRLGELEKAKMYFDQSLILSHELEDKSGIVKGLNFIGIIAQNTGNYEQAQKHYQESLELSYQIGDKSGIAYSLLGLKNVSYIYGNYEQAKKYIMQSLALFRETEKTRGISESLIHFASVVVKLGDYVNAQKYLKESLALLHKIKDKGGIAYSLSSLGRISILISNYEEAQKFFEESRAIFCEIGDKLGIAYSLLNLGTIAYTLGNYEKTQKYLEEGHAIFHEAGEKRGIASSLYRQGKLTTALGNYEQAQKFYEECIRISKDINYKINIVLSLIGIAGILDAKNHNSKAAQILGNVESALKSLCIVLEKNDQDFKKKITNELQEKLSDDEFEKYFEEGKKMTLEQAAELSLSNVK